LLFGLAMDSAGSSGTFSKLVFDATALRHALTGSQDRPCEGFFMYLLLFDAANLRKASKELSELQISFMKRREDGN
jgi:hypothetical protein